MNANEINVKKKNYDHENPQQKYSENLQNIPGLSGYGLGALDGE